MVNPLEQQQLETAMIGGDLPGVVLDVEKIPMGREVGQMATGTARSLIDKYVSGVLRIVTQNRKLDRRHAFSRMTVPRLLQMTALHFRTPEWRGLQTSIDAIPQLAAYVNSCKKVDNCIHAIFASRDILTLYELSIEVCLVLGTRSWEALGTLHNIEDNPCVIQYFGVQLPCPPPEVRSRDVLAFSFSQTDDTSLGDMLQSFANAQQIEVERPEYLGVWIRNLRSLIDLLDIEKRRISSELSRLEIEKHLQTEAAAKLVKWLIGILNTKHAPSPVNPLLQVRSKHVKSVFSNPATASAGHQHLVVSSIHKLLKPALDDAWVSDDSSGSSSSAEASATASSSTEVASSSSSSSNGRARGKIKRRKKTTMLTRLEKKVDQQHQRLIRRAERRSQKQLGAEQMEIVQDFVKQRELRENYQNFGVATREMVVETIKETLLKIPRASWAAPGTVIKVEQEVEENFSAPVDIVFSKVGKYPELLLEAVVAVDKEADHESKKRTKTKDNQSNEASLLPDSERVAEIATIVETAADRFHFDPLEATNTAALDFLHQLEARTKTLISKAAGKELNQFSDCKLGSFLQFLKENSTTSINGDSLLPKTMGTLSAVQSCNAPMAQMASAFAEVSACDRQNSEHRKHVEAALKKYIVPSSSLTMIGGKIPESPAAGGSITSVIKSHINAKCCLETSIIDTPEYNPHGINSDALCSKIKKLPPMTEISSALCWDRLLQRRFGKLDTFLSSNGVPFFTCGKIWNGEPEDVYLLVPESEATADHFKRALSRGAGKLATAILLGMFYSGNTSVELLAAFVESTLSNQPTDISKMAIIKDAIISLPGDTVLMFARQVFLAPLQGQVQTAFSGMLRISNPDERRRLREIGCILGISLWKRDYESWLLRQDTEILADYVDGTPITVSGKKPDAAAPVAATTEHQVQGTNQTINKPTDGGVKQSPAHKSTISSRKQETHGSPYDAIQSILRTEFGVGADLSDEGKLLHQTSSSRMGRAIERLASDLYSTDVHFVLELIQNADDNSYANDVLPSLYFDLSPSAVIVSNNEVGFSERNMRALCDVGSSTKAQSEGYIGMKGIGFKSVFRVTTAPEIHSGGFHISFDLATGPMGYIQPKWIGDGSEDDDRKKLAKEGRACSTQIVLPLTTDMSTGERRDVLLSKLEDIHPSLMLFVRKLRKISITDHISGSVREMTRFDLSNTVIDVQVNGSPCKWLVNRGQLIPEISRGDSRGNLKTTELALAFPMTQVEAEVELEEMMVFAFLPLRPCGFKFVLQADWTIPSSREDIDAGSPWNQWLRSKVGLLFVDSLSHFRTYFPDDEPHRALSAFLSFVPFGPSIAGFFRTVVADIRTLLLREKCLLTSLGTWATPEETVVFPDALSGEPCLLTEVVAPPSLLESDLKKYYLDPRVSVPSDVAAHLQLESFGLSHLIVIVKKRREAYDGNSAQWCNWLSRWLICLQYVLDGRCGTPPTGSTKTAVLREVRNLDIFPLSSGNLTSFLRGYIFFDVDEESSGSMGRLTPGFTSFFGSLRMLDSHLISSVSDNLAKEVLRNVLHSIGIRPMTPPEVVSSYILPLYQSINPSTDIISDDKVELLQATVLYVKDNMAKIGAASLQALSKCIILETSKGYVRPSETEVLTTSVYGNNCEIEKMHLKHLPNQHLASAASISDPGPWVQLSHIYLSLSQEMDADVNPYDPDVVESWATFMEAIGCRQFFSISKKKVVIDDYRTTKWAASVTAWPFATNSAEIIDFECPGLEEAITKLLEKEEAHRGTIVGSSCISCLRSIAEQLDADWHSRGFDHAKQVTFIGSSEAAQRHVMPSSLTLVLQNLKWLPTSHGYLSEGKNLLLESPSAAILRGAVPMLSLDLSNKSFITTMGIRTTVLSNDLIMALSMWSAEADHIPFSALLTEMVSLYELLAAGEVDPSIFASKKLIAIPTEVHTTGPASKHFSTYSFHAAGEISWEDPALAGDTSETIDVCMPHLSRAYPSCKDFFMNVLGVKKSPTFPQQVDFLEKQSDNQLIPQYAMNMFALWGSSNDSLAGSYNCNYARQKLSSAKLFLTHSKPNTLLCSDDKLFINDLPDQLTPVQTLPDINVLLPTRKTNSTAATNNILFSIFLVKPLSVATTITVTPLQVDWVATKQLWSSLNTCLPYAQRFIISKMPSLWNDQLSGDAVPKKIAETTLRVVSDMTCSVKVLAKEVKTGGAVIYSQSILYLKTAYAKEFSRVISELLKGVIKELGQSFNTPADEWAQLLDFSHRVVLQMVTDPRGVEVYASEKDILPLPVTVQKWFLSTLPAINETTDMFPKTAPNPTTAKPDRASSITREAVQAFDKDHVSTEEPEKRSSDPPPDEVVKRSKVDDPEEQAPPAVKAPQVSPDDEQAPEQPKKQPPAREEKEKIDRTYLPQQPQQSATSVAPAENVAPELRPFVRILRLWMKQGKAQFIAVPRDSTSQKLGIQFHPQTLSIKRHRPDTPAAAMAADLPIGFHVLACSGVPVRTVPQLAVELEKSQLCKLIVGCEGFPEDPISYLQEHEEAPTHSGSTISGGSMMRRRRPEDGQVGFMESAMGKRLSELNSFLNEDNSPQKSYSELVSGGKQSSGKGKGKSGKFKGGKPRVPTTEEIQTKGNPLYDGNGSLLGFLSTEGQFNPAGKDMLKATSGLWGDSTETAFDTWNNTLGRHSSICTNCGSDSHSTADCQLLGDEDNLPIGVSAKGGKKSSGGSKGRSKGDKGGKKGNLLPQEGRLFKPQDGDAFDKEQQQEESTEAEEMKVMKLQPYFDPKKDEADQLAAVQRANSQFQAYNQSREGNSNQFGQKRAVGIDSWEQVNEARQTAAATGERGGKDRNKKDKKAPNLYEPRPNDPGRQGSEDDVYQRIGRWGEQFVFRLLRSRASRQQEYVWVNEVEESGASYDIVERVTETSGVVTTTYIEVKATVATAKMFFEVSHREIQFAQANGPRFHIYRVFGAGSPSARLMVIKNPMLELKKGTIGISGSVRMTLLPVSRQNVRKPITKVITFERSSPSDPTGLNVRSDMIINKHVGDANVKASEIAPAGWKIQSVNGLQVKSISDMKAILRGGELCLSIVVESPTDDL